MSSNSQSTAAPSPRIAPRFETPWPGPTPATIGIIGGMGPDAGVDLAARFLAECRAWLTQRGKIVNDQLYPPHLLVQRPIVDRSRAIAEGGPDPLEGIVDACRTAIEAGATTLGIACNTAHLWHPKIAAASAPADVLHIAEIAARTVAERGFRHAALMSTAVTARSHLYHDALARHGVEVVEVSPAQRADLDTVIFDGIKAGNYALARPLAERVAHALLDNADCILLACTELPVALQHDTKLDRQRVIDATATLAEALARAAFRPCEPYFR